MNTRKNNPSGLVADKPIALRLMPSELEDAKRFALKCGVSESRLARAAYLKGLRAALAEFGISSTYPLGE